LAFVRENIWKSSCFLFTKCGNDDDKEIENMKQSLQTLKDTLVTQLSPELDQHFRDYLQFIIDCDRIFTIKAVK
jgi:hypothetical protein